MMLAILPNSCHLSWGVEGIAIALLWMPKHPIRNWMLQAGECGDCDRITDIAVNDVFKRTTQVRIKV